MLRSKRPGAALVAASAFLGYLTCEGARTALQVDLSLRDGTRCQRRPETKHAVTLDAGVRHHTNAGSAERYVDDDTDLRCRAAPRRRGARPRFRRSARGSARTRRPH